VKVAVMDFGGAMIRLKLRRRPGHDNVDVLELPDHPADSAAAATAVSHGAESPSLWGRVTGIFGGADAGVVSHGNQVHARWAPRPEVGFPPDRIYTPRA
jgi:hypothetical protein